MQKFIAWAEARRDIWLDFVRIYLGLGLLVRGLILLSNNSGYFMEMLQRTGESWLLTGVVLHYVMLAHFIGGAMLTIGFLTRIAALIQIPILIGAVFLVHRQEGLLGVGQSLEFSALVLFLLVVFVINGAGKLSLDYATFGAAADRHEEHVQPLAGS
jgi:putative oxidoreductase